MDRGALRATDHRVTKSWTQLSDSLSHTRGIFKKEMAKAATSDKGHQEVRRDPKAP